MPAKRVAPGLTAGLQAAFDQLVEHAPLDFGHMHPEHRSVLQAERDWDGRVERVRDEIRALELRLSIMAVGLSAATTSLQSALAQLAANMTKPPDPPDERGIRKGGA